MPALSTWDSATFDVPGRYHARPMRLGRHAAGSAIKDGSAVSTCFAKKPRLYRRTCALMLGLICVMIGSGCARRSTAKKRSQHLPPPAPSGAPHRWISDGTLSIIVDQMYAPVRFRLKNVSGKRVAFECVLSRWVGADFGGACFAGKIADGAKSPSSGSSDAHGQFVLEPQGEQSFIFASRPTAVHVDTVEVMVLSVRGHSAAPRLKCYLYEVMYPNVRKTYFDPAGVDLGGLKIAHGPFRISTKD
jgi:hypothetical protein